MTMIKNVITGLEWMGMNMSVTSRYLGTDSSSVTHRGYDFFD